MQKEQNKKILDQLADHEDRLQKLEGVMVGSSVLRSNRKLKTLNEIIKGKLLKSGQHKIAAIVGYQEKIIGKAPVEGSKIPELWKNSKIDGKYRSNFIERAVKDGLLRDLEDDTYDFSTGGEDFFNKLSGNEPLNTTLK